MSPVVTRDDGLGDELGDELARFQNDFLLALYHPVSASGTATAVSKLVHQPGFAVYRNTVIKTCIDALEANFPCVARLVGREWFRAAALPYVRATPPTSVMLMEYGADYADFLADFAPARALPYLPGVARLDRLWTEAHLAADAPALDAHALAALPAEALGAQRLRPHPATRWAWHSDQPIYTLWHANRAQQPLPDNLPWTADGVLLTRSGLDGAVRWQAAGPGLCAFLDACASDRTLAEAAEAALNVEPSLDLPGLLADLLNAGALTAAKTR
ncbi:putative DNA-binding domain-containing protein [Hylemonella sp. W303a]|uniref:HvfC/BufC family peptide modification chaperone n=1 Tax=Hylemonella sp. W303a TaxID=3389873 RepID=UPI00396B214E